MNIDHKFPVLVQFQNFGHCLHHIHELVPGSTNYHPAVDAELPHIHYGHLLHLYLLRRVLLHLHDVIIGVLRAYLVTVETGCLNVEGTRYVVIVHTLAVANQIALTHAAGQNSKDVGRRVYLAAVLIYYLLACAHRLQTPTKTFQFVE